MVSAPHCKPVIKPSKLAQVGNRGRGEVQFQAGANLFSVSETVTG